MDTEQFSLLLQEPNYLVDFVVLMLILVGTGLLLVAFHRRESALANHAPQILYLTFLLPIVLILAVFLGISKDAVVGLVGIIVGYTFGIALPVSGSARPSSVRDARRALPSQHDQALERAMTEMPPEQPLARGDTQAHRITVGQEEFRGPFRNIFEPSADKARPATDHGDAAEPQARRGKGSKGGEAAAAG